LRCFAVIANILIKSGAVITADFKARCVGSYALPNSLLG
jgi:hypothetical protein